MRAIGGFKVIAPPGCWSAAALRTSPAPAAHDDVRLPAHYLPALPCALTLGGLVCGLLGAKTLASGEVGVAVLWILLGQVLDIADGWVARRLGAVTRWGAQLDITSDRCIAVAMACALDSWAALFPLVLYQAGAAHWDKKLSGRFVVASLIVWGML